MTCWFVVWCDNILTPFPHCCSNVAEFNRGDLFVIRYRAVQQLLAEGAVELV